MSKSNALENKMLLLYFNNTAHANIGDATGLPGSATAGQLFLSLHTADPGEAGDQSTSEIAYTGYARVAIARSGAGFTVTGNSVSPAATVTFGQMTAGVGGTATHFGIGRATSGAGELLYSGTITPNISVVNGVTPQFSSTTVTED